MSASRVSSGLFLQTGCSAGSDLCDGQLGPLRGCKSITFQVFSTDSCLF